MSCITCGKPTWPPTLIDEPGMYTARNGKHVKVLAVKQGTGTFCVSAHIYLKGLNKKPKWNKWHPSGKFEAVNENPWDIIRKGQNT